MAATDKLKIRHIYCNLSLWRDFVSYSFRGPLDAHFFFATLSNLSDLRKLPSHCGSQLLSQDACDFEIFDVESPSHVDFSLEGDSKRHKTISASVPPSGDSTIHSVK